MTEDCVREKTINTKKTLITSNLATLSRSINSRPLLYCIRTNSPLLDSRNGRNKMRRPDRPSDLPSRTRKCFPRRGHSKSLIPYLSTVDGGYRNVWFPNWIENNVLVDFVRQDYQIRMFRRNKIGNPFEFVFAKYFSGGIVR